MTLHKHNKSEVTGVFHIKRSGSWMVKFSQDYIATYKDFDSAVKRRFEEELKHSTSYNYLKDKELIPSTR